MKTYKYKLYNSKNNKYLFSKIDIASEIWNYCINLHRRYYRIYKKFINKYKLINHVVKLKKTIKYNHWYDLNSQAIQDVIFRIDKAYSKFFKDIKRKIKTSPPKFKKKCNYKSFTLKHHGYKLLKNNKIIIQKKTYKYFKSRNIEDNIKQITIKRNILGEIFIFIITDFTKVHADRQGNSSIGIDFGLKQFLTLSNGTKITSPLFFKQSLHKIKHASKQLSNKKKGSKNHYKSICNLFRKHDKIVNQRANYFYKLSIELCREFDIICIEDLDIKIMQALWGRKICDLAFSNFVLILEYMCKKHGVKLVKIDRYYASSKICNVCKVKNDDLTLSDRIWICSNCGSKHDRDINAAKNIRVVGASTIAGETVRHTLCMS